MQVSAEQRRTLTSLSFSFALTLSSASMLVSILESRVSRRRYHHVCIALSGHVIRVSTFGAQSLPIHSQDRGPQHTAESVADNVSSPEVLHCRRIPCHALSNDVQLCCGP